MYVLFALRVVNVPTPLLINALSMYVLFALRVVNVPTPVTLKSVAPIPPLTCRVYCGTVVPTPTLFVCASATIRLVSTSNPFFMTKFF